MILKQRLFSNMFFRNMVADVFGRTAYTKMPGGFIPYFQYKLGKYRREEYYLYFPNEPFALRYKNEIFNKLCEYDDSDIARFLDFHYSVYSDNQAFLRFLHYEIAGRLSRSPKESRRQKFKPAEQWIAEKQMQLREMRIAELKREIVEVVKEIIPRGQDLINQERFDRETEALSIKSSDRIELILSDLEERMQMLTGSLPAGNIQLNNYNHEEKLLQLFYMVQTIQVPTRIAKGEQLFKKFTNHDLASVLHLHFEGFTDKKLNTVEKNIRESRDLLRPENPKVRKLTEALQEFFY